MIHARCKSYVTIALENNILIFAIITAMWLACQDPVSTYLHCHVFKSTSFHINFGLQSEIDIKDNDRSFLNQPWLIMQMQQLLAESYYWVVTSVRILVRVTVVRDAALLTDTTTVWKNLPKRSIRDPKT